MKRAAIAAAALALALTGCSAADPEPTADGTVTQDTFLTAHGLAGMDAVEIIDHLDRQKVTERPTDLIASVRADELLLSRRPVRCWWTRRQPPSTTGLLASGFPMMPPA